MIHTSPIASTHPLHVRWGKVIWRVFSPESVSSAHNMNWVQARRLGLLSGFAVGILLLLRGLTLPSGLGGGGRRQSTEPGETQPGTVLPHSDTSDVNAERTICASTPPYDMAFCLAGNDALQTPPPLAELPCRWEEDLVANGAHRCLSFASLVHDQSRLKSRRAFQLYPQDVPAQEVVRRAKRGLPIGIIDKKHIEKMFLERLPADVQTILASGSQDLTVSQLAEVADRMLEVQRLQPPSVAQTSTSSSTVNEQLMKQMSAMADEMAPPKLQLVRQTSSRSPSRRRSRSRLRTADICWYHNSFGAKARRCSSSCSFKSKQKNQLARKQTRPFSRALPALVAPSMFATM
ncbi:hypothetical protein SprV_0702329800 [Sparganum proliferum]